MAIKSLVHRTNPLVLKVFHGGLHTMTCHSFISLQSRWEYCPLFCMRGLHGGWMSERDFSDYPHSYSLQSWQLTPSSPRPTARMATPCLGYCTSHSHQEYSLCSWRIAVWRKDLELVMAVVFHSVAQWSIKNRPPEQSNWTCKCLSRTLQLNMVSVQELFDMSRPRWTYFKIEVLQDGWK